MKKTYMSPEILMVKLDTIGMIASSQNSDLNSAPDYSEGGELSGSREDNIFDLASGLPGMPDF